MSSLRLGVFPISLCLSLYFASNMQVCCSGICILYISLAYLAYLLCMKTTVPTSAANNSMDKTTEADNTAFTNPDICESTFADTVVWDSTNVFLHSHFLYFSSDFPGFIVK